MKNAVKVVSAFVGIVLFTAALITIPAYAIMLAWGALGTTFGFTTIGYGTAYLLAWVLAIVTSAFKPNKA